MLSLCGEDAAVALRPYRAGHAADSQQMAVPSLSAGRLPVHPRRKGIPVPSFLGWMPLPSQHVMLSLTRPELPLV